MNESKLMARFNGKHHLEPDGRYPGTQLEGRELTSAT